MRAPGSTRTSQAVSAVSWFGGKGGFKAIIYFGNAPALLRSSEGGQPLPAPKALSARHPEPPPSPGWGWGRDRDADRGWNVPPHPPPRLAHGQGTPPGSRARPGSSGSHGQDCGGRCLWAPSTCEWPPGSGTRRREKGRAPAEWTGCGALSFGGRGHTDPLGVTGPALPLAPQLFTTGTCGPACVVTSFPEKEAGAPRLGKLWGQTFAHGIATRVCVHTAQRLHRFT